MIEPKYKVTYISNSCGNRDELSNQPHESVANSLYSLITEHKEIKHPIIGLEGSWGSGKSQVINILERIIGEKKQKDNFCFITYDIWGAQEDLTRRSFLDNILNKSKDNDKYFETTVLKEDYAKLNATSIVRKTRTFPSVRLFYAILLLIPISTFVLNSIEGSFGYNPSAKLTYDEFKAYLHLAFAVLSLIVFICSYCKELNKINSEADKKNITSWEKFKIIIGRILYIFKEKDVEKEDYETIITDEPSVSRFQNTFDHIYKSLKEDKKLIIVFDNMDRLSDSSKLMSTWSLLHTFFAEANYQGKIWAIVPYAKQQLSDLMNSEDEEGKNRTSEFINKTFFTTFRIPEPIMGSWKTFLYNKLDQAFNPSIESDEKTLLALIFSRSMAQKQIRPRDIIVYVNKLVSLYSQHYFEEIPLGAIAIYAQYEDLFSTPLRAILKFEGFESLTSLFEDKEKLSGWLSSIHYNLPAKDALEVTYERSITEFLQSDYDVIGDNDEKAQAFSELSSHKSFKHHIEEFFNAETDYANLKMENIFYLLDKSNITPSTRHKIYENIANQIQTLKDQFTTYESWMEYGFINCNEKHTNIIIDCLLKESQHDFECYYRTIIELLRIKSIKSSIKLEIRPYKTESVQEMVNFAQFLKEEQCEHYYPKTRISIDSSKLLEYMKEGASSGELFGENTNQVYDLLHILTTHKVDISNIADAINNASITITNLTTEKVERIYKVFNIINPSIQSIPSYTSTSTTTSKHLEIPEYLACVIYKLIDLNSTTSTINNALIGDLHSNAKSVCSYITKYVSTDDLFEIALNSSNVLLKQLLQLYVSEYADTISTSGYLIENTSAIIQSVLTPCEDRLMSLINLNADNIINIDNINWLEIDEYWTDIMNTDSIKEHRFCKVLCEKWIDALNLCTKEELKAAFTRSDLNLSSHILKLEEESLLPSEFWSKTELDSAVKDSYLGYTKDENKINIELFDYWKQHVGESARATLANHVIESISSPSRIDITKLSMLVRLYIGNSQRLLEEKYACTFYDDYFNRYVAEAPIESLLQHTIEKWDRIYNFSKLLNKDRVERLSTIMKQRTDEIPKESSGREKWEKCINEIYDIYKGF